MIRTLLLAAGASQRFGTDKLLAPLDRGVPMVAATALRLLAADCRVLAVVRPGVSEVGELLAGLPGVAVTQCLEADRGMGHSLACGVARSAGAAGWLVALGDMPFLKPASVRAVAAKLEQGASIAAPVFDGRRGHPVGFSSEWRDDLMQLTGDSGGVQIIRRFPHRIDLVPCDDPGVLRDVDVSADLSA